LGVRHMELAENVVM